MKIAIVGNGNVATVLGNRLQAAGHEIVAVVARNKAGGELLAAKLHTSFHHLAEKPALKTELVLIALADNALSTGLPRISAGDATWVHTAGSVSMEALKGYATNYGVLYPLQSIHKNKELPTGIPFLVDGVNEHTKANLWELAKTISTKVGYANDEERMQYHLAAVLVSNFTNHLYRLAQDYLVSQSLDFSILQPLIVETVDRLQQYKASEVQTGPAVRNDTQTIARHLELLDRYPEIAQLYTALSASILRVNSNNYIVSNLNNGA